MSAGFVANVNKIGIFDFVIFGELPQLAKETPAFCLFFNLGYVQKFVLWRSPKDPPCGRSNTLIALIYAGGD